jgi:hypothetical protein
VSIRHSKFIEYIIASQYTIRAQYVNTCSHTSRVQYIVIVDYVHIHRQKLYIIAFHRPRVNIHWPRWSYITRSLALLMRQLALITCRSYTPYIKIAASICVTAATIYITRHYTSRVNIHAASQHTRTRHIAIRVSLAKTRVHYHHASI